MAKHYKVIASATGLDTGSIVTDEQIDKDHANLGGVQRLLDLKTIEEVSASEAKKITDAGDPRSPELTTGDNADKVSGPKAEAQKVNERINPRR